MKKILLILMTTITIFSQQENINVDITKLSQQELVLYQKLKQQSSNTLSDNLSIEKLDKYSQIGKAFGTAFKECWSAISNDAERFGQSSAGKWAMILVSWKIMGNDAIEVTKILVRWCVGSMLLLTGIPFFIYIIRRNCILSPIKNITKTGWFSKKIEYSESLPIHSEGIAFYLVGVAIFLAIISLIMFI